MARREGSLDRARQRKPRARDRAWQSMRILRCFTIADLIATAEIGRANVQIYMLWLERSGYLRRTAERRSGQRGGFVVYRLVRDTGPYAPRADRGRVHDINTEVTHD